jgi:hypothetical protein
MAKHVVSAILGIATIPLALLVVVAPASGLIAIVGLAIAAPLAVRYAADRDRIRAASEANVAQVTDIRAARARHYRRSDATGRTAV